MLLKTELYDTEPMKSCGTESGLTFLPETSGVKLNKLSCISMNIIIFIKVNDPF
jgi:hypothetical protein